MRLLFIFLFISAISYAQGKVMSRHDNGQKEWVNVYSGTGTNEKLIKRIKYDKYRILPTISISYSTSGYITKWEKWSIVDNKRVGGTRYLSEKWTSVDGYKKCKAVYYNPDGTIAKTQEYDSYIVE